MNGSISIVDKWFGHLQRVTGANVIDLNGPISIYRGDSATLRLTVTDDEDARVDLTGATIELQVKAALGDADPALITASVGSGITLRDQTDDEEIGQADIALTSANTNRTPGLFYLDVVVEVSGTRQHLMVREFTVDGVVNAP